MTIDKRVAEYRMFESPRYVGFWTIGGVTGIRVATLNKPRWLTRVLCSWLLEWTWTDGELSQTRS